MNILYPRFALVFGLLSVLTNGFSGLVLYRNHSLTYGSPIIYYFITLTCVYFLKGIVTVCWSTSVLADCGYQEIFFGIGQCAYWTTALCLFLTLLAMAVERYINTVSLKRFQWLRARKTVYIYFCLIIVVFSLIFGQLVALGHMGPYVQFFICLLSEVAYILALIIFVRCWLNQKKRAKENIRHQEITQTSVYRANVFGQKRLSILVLCYILGTLVTVLPYFVAFQAKLVSELFYDGNVDGRLKKLLEIYSMFTCLNYGLTPIFYFCVLPQFKKCLYLLLSCQASHQRTLEGSIVTQVSEDTTSVPEFV